MVKNLPCFWWNYAIFCFTSELHVLLFDHWYSLASFGPKMVQLLNWREMSMDVYCFMQLRNRQKIFNSLSLLVIIIDFKQSSINYELSFLYYLKCCTRCTLLSKAKFQWYCVKCIWDSIKETFRLGNWQYKSWVDDVT